MGRIVAQKEAVVTLWAKRSCGSTSSGSDAISGLATSFEL